LTPPCFTPILPVKPLPVRVISLRGIKMDIFTDLLIPLLVGLLAAYGGMRYADAVSFRQQKALLTLFIQEFSILLRRSSMYYQQYIEGPVSFSTMFESSDAATFNKLAEVTDNIKIIETALMLKSDFFQVLRYADRSSEAVNTLLYAEASGNKELASQAADKARQTQQMALNYFMGEIFVDGRFHRFKYDYFIRNLNLLIDYLERLNTPSRLKGVLITLMPRLRRKKEDIQLFIENRRKELSLLREKLDLLREKEKRALLGKKTASNAVVSESED
jgi:hypothetical protein